MWLAIVSISICTMRLLRAVHTHIRVLFHYMTLFTLFSYCFWLFLLNASSWQLDLEISVGWILGQGSCVALCQRWSLTAAFSCPLTLLIFFHFSFQFFEFFQFLFFILCTLLDFFLKLYRVQWLWHSICLNSLPTLHLLLFSQTTWWSCRLLMYSFKTC